MKEISQHTNQPSQILTVRPFAIWFAGASFTLFQFFLQLSSGVILSTIMLEMNLTGFLGGMLGSAFYYVYTAMQIPAGIFFDRYNPRTLIAGSALLCSLGCIFSAQSHEFHTFLISRLLIGAGSSFAFIGLSHLLRQHFPLKYFGLLLGLSETLAFLIIALGVANLSGIISQWGWRIFMLYAGGLGISISLLTWIIIPKRNPSYKSPWKIPSNPPLKMGEPDLLYKGKNLSRLFANPYLWLNGLFVFFSFITITVYGAMWAVPFLQMKLQCSLNQAAQIDSWLFFGAALSCPFAGLLTTYIKTHQTVTIGSSLITAILILLTLYTTSQQTLVYALLMFLTGLFCGGYMLAFSICNHLASLQHRTTATGFTNTMAMLSAPILMPYIGYLTDKLTSNGQSGLVAFQISLTIVPVLLMIAAVMAYYLPNQKGEDLV